MMSTAANEAAAQETSPFPPRADPQRVGMDDSSLPRTVEGVSKIFDEIQTRNNQANAQVSPPITDPHVIKFREAVPRFLEAVMPFQSAVLSGGDFGRYAKVIEKQTDVFLSYTKWMGSKAARPDTSELEKLKPEQRSGEMIVSLSRTLINLTQVLADDKNPATSTRQAELIKAFEAETYRLKWLSSHLH